MLPSLELIACSLVAMSTLLLTLAAQGLNRTLLAAAHTYHLSRASILRIYAPIEPYATALSMVWTIAILCNLARQAILAASRRSGLPKPTTGGRSRRIKLAIPISWWFSVHFVLKPKTKGYLMKLGASFEDIKVLLVFEKSKGSAASIKRQIKCYGGISILKFSTTIDR